MLYETVGLDLGMTVDEFERSNGLSAYSIYPEARGVTIEERGFFMYRNATYEEREAGNAA